MKKKNLAALFLSILLLVSPVVQAAGAGDAAGTGSVWAANTNGLGVTVRMFEMQLKHEGLDFVQICREGVEAAPSDLVSTGMEIRVLDEFGALARTIDLVVVGDVIGTGIAGMQQVIRMAGALSGEPLEGLFLLAADLDESGQFTISDLVLAAAQASRVASTPDYERTETDYPTYAFGDQPAGDTQTISFFNGNMDIPYFSVKDGLEFLTMYGAPYTYKDEGNGIVTLTNSEGYWAEINCDSDTVVFFDFEAFFKKSYAATIMDITQSNSFLERPEGSYALYGVPIILPLKDYNIDLVYEDGIAYMPLQTFADIFLQMMSTSLLFNGEAVFLSMGSMGIGAAQEAYYAAPTGERSEVLAEFSYNELCLFLDMYYGLQEQHDITQFDLLFEQTGLKERFLSSNPEDAADALLDLLVGVFDDGHSAYLSNSYLFGQDARPSLSMPGSSLDETMRNMERFSSARAKFYPDGVPGYEEVGDTAYVTFDSFSVEVTKDYSTIVPANNPDDTVELIMYAHAQIMRDDSPIENVVIDLSNNAGGAADAAVAVAAWFLGGTTTINLNSTLSGAQASIKYAFDVNQDGVYDADDSVASKRLFCITSPLSFSCGNLVPACFKASDEVTLLGMDSGGGACVVAFGTTADGTGFCISGPRRLSGLFNGAFYDIDKGIKVDVPITQIDHFYDRELLMDFVNGIFR